MSRAVYRAMVCSLSSHLLSHRVSIHSSSVFCLLTSNSSPALLLQAALPPVSPELSPLFPYPCGLLSCTIICSPVSHLLPPPSVLMPLSHFDPLLIFPPLTLLPPLLPVNPV